MRNLHRSIMHNVNLHLLYKEKKRNVHRRASAGISEPNLSFGQKI